MKPRDGVDPPTFTPRDVGRLLSVVQPRFGVPDPHWRNGVVYSPTCGGADTTYDPCIAIDEDGDQVPEPPAKEPTAAKVKRGATPVTVRAQMDCNPVGFWEEAQERAEDALARAEGWQVEQAFWTGVTADQTTVFPHLAADAELVDEHDVVLQQPATIVGGPGAVDVAEGMGVLEQALADCYHGVGVIHVPESLVPVLADAKQIVKDGQRYRTWNGNLVAAGAGYPGTGPDGSAPPAGATWMYATGAIFAYRSQPHVTRAPEDAPGEAFDRNSNTVKMHAERTYVLGWDCCLLAVLVEQRGEGAAGVEANDIQADEPLSWDAGTTTMSLEPGSDGQVMMTEGGTPQWESLGQPGGIPGPLDGSGNIPTSQLPPAEFHTTFAAGSEAEMLAEPAEAPSICIRTDFDPPHLFFLHTDPATDIGNWEDLGAGISTSDDPSAQVGTAPINGVAATYMRSDAAPAINQGMSPTWTGNHVFSGTLNIPGGSAGQVATNDGAGNAQWQDPAVQAADLAAKVSKAGDTMTGDLHMSEQKVVNIADGTNPRDAVNRQQLDATAAAATTGLAGKVAKAGDTMSGGLSFGSDVAANAQDNSRHISLWGTGYGINVTQSSMNFNTDTLAAATKFAFYEAGTAVGLIQDPVTDPKALTTKEYVDAAVAPAPADQTADATLQNQHPAIQLCDATAGAINLNLVADTPGKQFTIKKVDASANTVTVAPPVPIDGQASIVLTNQYEWLSIVRGNNNNWHIIGRGGN